MEIEEKNKIRNEQFPQDFRMRYSIHIDDIKYIKGRQWSVTYYILLVFPAIIYFHEIIRPLYQGILPCWQKVILFIIASLFALLGTTYQLDFQKRLSTYRKRLLEIRGKLSDDFSNLEKSLSDESDEEYTSKYRAFCKFCLPFILMLWVGVFFVFWYLFLIPVR